MFACPVRISFCRSGTAVSRFCASVLTCCASSLAPWSVASISPVRSARRPGAGLVRPARDGGARVLRVGTALLRVVVAPLERVVDLTGAVGAPARRILQVRERRIVGELGMLLDQGRQGVVHLIGAGGQR